MYNRKLDKIMIEVDKMSNVSNQHIFFNEDDYSIKICKKEGKEIIITADDAPTLQKMIRNFEDRHIMTMGPRGSSKSTLTCAKILWVNYHNPPCKDGVKRSRWVIGRQTYGNLRTSTIKTFEHWFGHEELGWQIKQAPPIQANLSYFDGSNVNEIEIFFISFDKEKDAEKVLSLDLTGAYFNEAAAIPSGAIYTLEGALGRYPSKIDRQDGHFWNGILYDANAFADYHPFYDKFVKRREEGYRIYVQPGGLIETAEGKFIPNKEAENTNNLPDNYYYNMSIGKPKSFIRTQICNKFGTFEAGKAVHPEFKVDLHSVEKIEIDRNHPIWLMHDFGGTNATLILQYISGKLFAICEIIGYKEGLTDFQKNRVNGWLRRNASGVEVSKSIGDRADNYSHDTASYSLETVSRELGIRTYPSITNVIKARIDAVDRLISKRFADGSGALLISKSGCPILFAGMCGKYKLEMVKRGESRIPVEKPIKDEYSHSADCLQYAALEVKKIEENRTKRKPLHPSLYRR